MEKRDKEMPYEVIIQERNKVDLYGNVAYYIYWFDKYGNDITNEWKFWSKGPKKKYDRVNRYLTDDWLKKYKDKSREDEDCEEWEEVDSCWGCYEETDELIKEVMIENGLEE